MYNEVEPIYIYPSDFLIDIEEIIQYFYSDMLLGFRYGLFVSVIIFFLVFTFSEVLQNATKMILSK